MAHNSGGALPEEPDQLVEVVARDLLRLGQDEHGPVVAGTDGLPRAAVFAY
jgi:hypothetical protein